LICAIRSRFGVKIAVRRPMRAAATAASQPACPAPTTTTSYCSLKLTSSILNRCSSPRRSMRILLIGGNGFIGSSLVRELRASEHEPAIFHRRADAGLSADVVKIRGDRNRLSDYRSQIQQFSPDVIIDLILSSGEQARQVVDLCRGLARRVLAISSM